MSIYNDILKAIENFTTVDEVRSYLQSNIDGNFLPDYTIRFVGDKKSYVLSEIPVTLITRKFKGRDYLNNRVFLPFLTMNPISLLRYIKTKNTTTRDLDDFFMNKKLEYFVGGSGDIYLLLDGVKTIRIGFNCGYYIIVLKPNQFIVNKSQKYDHTKSDNYYYDLMCKELEPFKRSDKLQALLKD